MGRRKGSLKNNASYRSLHPSEMSIEDRIRLIANIIADRIQSDINSENDKQPGGSSNV